MNQENTGTQNSFLYQRQRAHLDGIEEVESFSDTEITALSFLGRICIEGEELHIDQFSTETGGLEIHGKINGLYYLDREPDQKKGFFAKLVR